MPESPHSTSLSVNLHLKPDATAKGTEVGSTKYVQILAHPCEVTLFLPPDVEDQDAAIEAIVAAFLSLKSDAAETAREEAAQADRIERSNR